MFAAQQVTDDRIWDAAKLEIARVVSLGVTGFDSPVAGHSLAEADAALAGRGAGARALPDVGSGVDPPRLRAGRSARRAAGHVGS
jgi:cytochrome c peroxidase